MHLLKVETLRRLIPAFVVGGVLLASFLAQVPSLASNSDVGYGYGNNCGVKGDGFHDHGKVCPNRPFPGHGNGVLRILGTLPLGVHPNGKQGIGHSSVNDKTLKTLSVIIKATAADEKATSSSAKPHHPNRGRGQGHRNIT